MTWLWNTSKRLPRGVVAALVPSVDGPEWHDPDLVAEWTAQAGRYLAAAGFDLILLSGKATYDLKKRRLRWRHNRKDQKK